MRNFKDNFKFRKYIVIDKNSLNSVGIVSGKEWLFKGRRFSRIVALCFAIVIVSVFSVIGTVVYYNARIIELKYDRAKSVKACMFVNDSLMYEIGERDRLDTFILICYEAMTTPCPKATHDNVWEFVKRCDSWYPDIVMMQAVQESGAGKSAVAGRCNNLFGMTKPENRKLRCDINRGNRKEKYAEYPDWRFSVIDRILWERWIFRNHKKKPSVDEYMKVIENIYSETEGYGESVYRNAEKYRKML